MSKEKSSSPDSSEAPTTDGKANRRAARPRSGKPTKSSKTAHPATEEPVGVNLSPPYPVFDLAEPEPSNESPKSFESGEVSPQEKAKRKRRRKKGKGGISPNASPAAPVDATSEVPEEKTAAEPAALARPPRQEQKRLDPDKINKLALKIYLAEVSEEGVALIGDSDAKELSRRCFRLAEIFVEEESRRR